MEGEVRPEVRASLLALVEREFAAEAEWIERRRSTVLERLAETERMLVRLDKLSELDLREMERAQLAADSAAAETMSRILTRRAGVRQPVVMPEVYSMPRVLKPSQVQRLVQAAVADESALAPRKRGRFDDVLPSVRYVVEDALFVMHGVGADEASTPATTATAMVLQLVCPHCGRVKFSNRLSLLHHLRAVHEAECVSFDQLPGLCGVAVSEDVAEAVVRLGLADTTNIDAQRRDAEASTTHLCSAAVATVRSAAAVDEQRPEKRARVDGNAASKSAPVSNSIVPMPVGADKWSRFLVRKRVIVGNTSRYVRSSADQCTHRWTVFVVSGEPGDRMELWLAKVRFFLHDSFAPRNVVDVTTPPFALRRRGWGEFPVRAQLHFVDRANNKPVDIIHPIRFDKTNSGDEVRAPDTVVDLELDRAFFQALNACDQQQQPAASRPGGPDDDNAAGRAGNGSSGGGGGENEGGGGSPTGSANGNGSSGGGGGGGGGSGSGSAAVDGDAAIPIGLKGASKGSAADCVAGDDPTAFHSVVFNIPCDPRHSPRHSRPAAVPRSPKVESAWHRAAAQLGLGPGTHDDDDSSDYGAVASAVSREAAVLRLIVPPGTARLPLYATYDAAPSLEAWCSWPAWRRRSVEWHRAHVIAQRLRSGLPHLHTRNVLDLTRQLGLTPYDAAVAQRVASGFAYTLPVRRHGARDIELDTRPGVRVSGKRRRRLDDPLRSGDLEPVVAMPMAQPVPMVETRDSDPNTAVVTHALSKDQLALLPVCRHCGSVHHPTPGRVFGKMQRDCGVRMLWNNLAVATDLKSNMVGGRPPGPRRLHISTHTVGPDILRRTWPENAHLLGLPDADAIPLPSPDLTAAVAAHLSSAEPAAVRVFVEALLRFLVQLTNRSVSVAMQQWRPDVPVRILLPMHVVLAADATPHFDFLTNASLGVRFTRGLRPSEQGSATGDATVA